MVRDDHARRAVLHGFLGVFRVQNAFDEHGQVGDPRKPLQIFPREGLVEERCDVGGEPRALRVWEVVRAHHIFDAQPVGELKVVLHVALAHAPHLAVYSQHDRSIARRFRAAHEVFSLFAVSIHVELKPHRTSSGVRDLFDGGGGEGAQHHRRTRLACCPRYRNLSLGMRHAVKGGRRDEYGHRDLLPQHRRAEVALADVAQHAVFEPVAVKGARVVAERDLVVGAAYVIVERHLRELLFRRRFVLVKVERFHIGSCL